MIWIHNQVYFSYVKNYEFVGYRSLQFIPSHCALPFRSEAAQSGMDSALNWHRSSLDPAPDLVLDLAPNLVLDLAPDLVLDLAQNLVLDLAPAGVRLSPRERHGSFRLCVSDRGWPPCAACLWSFSTL